MQVFAIIFLFFTISIVPIVIVPIVGASAPLQENKKQISNKHMKNNIDIGTGTQIVKKV